MMGDSGFDVALPEDVQGSAAEMRLEGHHCRLKALAERSVYPPRE